MHRVWVKDLRRDEDDDQADVFNIIQKRPNTVNGIHLKVEEAMEGRTSHKEGRSRYV